MTAVAQRSAAVLELDNPMGPRPQPAAEAAKGKAQIIEIVPGVWAVCVFDLIPKNGFGHLAFPHYWGRLGDNSIWRVARHGEVPDGTFVFTSEAEAEAVLARTFDGETDLRSFMSRISVPSDDHRMTASGTRAPRHATASGGEAR